MAEQTAPLVFLPESSDTVPAPGVTSCSSMDCLVGLARSCGKGEFTYSVKSPFPLDSEMTVQSRGYYRIDGSDTAGRCTFTSRARGATVTMSPPSRVAALARGLTEAAINVQLKTISDSVNSEEAVKSVTTCTGANVNVAQFFRNAAQGTASSSCTIQMGAKVTRCTMEPSLACVTRMP